jgi:hypothetical protein
MKPHKRWPLLLAVYLAVAFAMSADSSRAEDKNAQTLAQAAQNPVADMNLKKRRMI